MFYMEMLPIRKGVLTMQSVPPQRYVFDDGSECLCVRCPVCGHLTSLESEDRCGVETTCTVCGYEFVLAEDCPNCGLSVDPQNLKCQCRAPYDPLED